MSIQSAYQGCCVNPNWFFNPDFTLKLPETLKFDLLAGVKLTDQEQEILKKLVETYDLFTNLENRSDADNKEFVDAVHRAQQLIALRVARRVNPEVWHQP